MSRQDGSGVFRFLGVLVGMTVLLVGCDTTVPVFENSQDDPLYYSLYGRISYPDGGTIRVEPLRDSILRGTRGEASEVVTFTKVSTGEADTLEVHSRQVDQLPVRNYRTPGGLEAGASYRIRVEGPNGNASSARITIPERAPEVEVVDSLYGEEGYRVRVRFGAVERLAQVSMKYCTRYGVSPPYRWTRRSQAVGDDKFRAYINTEENLRDITARHTENDFGRPSPATAQAASLTVTAAGPGWPGRDFNISTFKETVAPNRVSNVQQGVGIVVGTHSTTTEVLVRERRQHTLSSCPE